MHKDQILENGGIKPNEVLTQAPNIAMGIGAAAAGIDAFTGEANPFNSGETIVNLGLGAGTLGASLIGAEIGSKMADLPQEEIDKRIKETRASASEDLRSGKINREEYTNRVNQSKRRYERKEGMLPNSSGGLTKVKGSSANMIQGGRRGAAIGAAAMLVPSIMAMRDQPKLAQQADSLM